MSKFREGDLVCLIDNAKNKRECGIICMAMTYEVLIPSMRMKGKEGRAFVVDKRGQYYAFPQDALEHFRGKYMGTVFKQTKKARKKQAQEFLGKAVEWCYIHKHEIIY